jgi:AraC family transcriptional regulator
MGDKNRTGISESANAAQARPPTVRRLIVPAIDVVREGRPEPFLNSRPTGSSAPAQWGVDRFGFIGVSP